MQCLQCQTDNRAGRRFCAACGAPLAQACAACGFVNEPGEHYCGGCGIALATAPTRSPAAYTPTHLAERIRANRRALEGERKQVTVLFADVKGSMELLADRDPEEAQHLLDALLKWMLEAVHRFEGTVSNVMGDGIMALFGAPVAHEDHAVRAGYAALKMQAAVATHAPYLERQYGVRPQIRVGLHTGEVVVGRIGNNLAMEYTAVGRTTHLAARMEQLATPGTILVTEAFARLTEDYLRYRGLGPLPVKGLQAPLAVYELIGAAPPRTRFQAAVARGLTRFVGRRPELDTLHQAQVQVQAHHGQLVAVIGDAGVGKSRLFHECVNAPAFQDWRVIAVDAGPPRQENSFVTVRNLLLAFFQIDDRDDERRIREKIDKRLSTDMALWQTLPALLALLDVRVEDPEWQALDAHQRRIRTIEGVKHLLFRHSQSQPLVMIIENLQWMDAGTQAFLDSLVDDLATKPILCLVNYHPGYQHGWGNKPYYRQFRLEPLSTAMAGELLHTLLGDDPRLQELKQLLVSRTKGNPLFLEESVRTLVETQALQGKRGAYQLVQALPTIEIPASVHSVLASRIDRLRPEEKHLLQTAAVIGEQVSFTLLEVIADMPEDALHRSLARLRDAEFLHEVNLFPDLEYAFQHGLTHAVAYSSVLHERRRLLHARIVDALEALYADRLLSQVEQLARHAFQGEVWEKAVTYYRQAGTKAATRSAYQEAVTCFEQALAALQRLPEEEATLRQAFDLRLELRPWLVPLANYARILANLQEAETIAESLGDRRRLGVVSAYMTDYFRLTGASPQAVACGERTLALALALDDLPLRVLAHMLLGHACHATGEYRRAVQLLTQNMALLHGALSHERFGSAGLPAVLSRSFMVFSLVELGEFDRGLLIGGEAVRIAEEADTAHSQVLAVHSVGLVYLYQGAIDQAIPLLEHTLQRCQEGHIPLGSRLLASTLGYAYLLASRVGEAIPLLERAVQQAETLNVFFRYALWLVWLGEAYARAGRLDEAEARAQQALTHAQTHQEPGHQAYAFWLTGEIACQRGPQDVVSAEDAYHEARRLARALGMRPLQAHCALSLGRLQLQCRRAAQARQALTDALAAYTAMDMKHWRAQVEMLLPAGDNQES